MTNKLFGALVIILVVISAIGGVVILTRFSPNKPLEISIPQSQEPEGRIFISGAVNNPGVYSFTSKDSISSFLQSADITSSANLSGIKLYVPQGREGQVPQKIDINRADAWLLEALPEIGKTLAERIVEYRGRNGQFRNIRDITKIAGIDTNTYEKIKDLITVAD